MQVQTEKHYYTPEEYLALEEKAEYKSEYHDGEIIPMTGGTTNHNKIAGKFYAQILLVLEDKDYEIYMGDVRLWIPRYRQYTYPDIMVVKGQPVYAENSTTTINNPMLIAEVLSKSTKNYDQGDKFDYYRSIPEFKEYILIDQYTFKAKQFAKNSEGKWVLTEYEEADSTIVIESVDFQINFNSLYSKPKSFE